MRILPGVVIALSTIAVVNAAKQSEEDQKLQKLRELSCLIYDDLSFYDIRSLKTEKGYHDITDQIGNKFAINLCDFVSTAQLSTSTFGFKINKDFEFYALTNSTLENLKSTVEETADG